tara:strand:+ start:122 stop:1129 length:1008 start_codon:yes stop_codon:yes gene_type:complete
MEDNANVNNNLVKEKEGIKNDLTIFTVNMLNLYSQNERSGNPEEDITLHKIKTRHFLIYYLYRVFCKYRDIIMNVVSTEEINNLYKLLNIPENSRGCMPMAGRMSNKKAQLDTTLFTLIKVLNDFNMNQSGLVAEDKFNDMMEFFKSNKNPKKILENIKILDILIPNLSSTNIEYNVFNKDSKKAALTDLGIEPASDDVSLNSSNTAPNTNQPTITQTTNVPANNTVESMLSNNKLQQQLEDEEKKEFNASEVAIQNTPPTEQEEVLPQVSPLNSGNQSIPEIPTNTSIPGESASTGQSPMDQTPMDQTPIVQPPQMNTGGNENDLDLLNKENNN